MKINIILIIILLLANKSFSQKDSLISNTIYQQYFYTNGKISSEGFLKDNKPMGLWKAYYLTGLKKSEGTWKNNKLDSVWIFYDQFGDTIEKINYYLGHKNGYHFKYFKIDNYKNKIFSKELYLNGKRNDKSFIFYETGEIKRVIPFVDDKKQGLGFNFDRNGTIISIIRYRNNEIITQEDINRFNENQNRDGIWREYYKNGNIKEEKNYLDGKLHGYFKIYDEEGKLLSALKYTNGQVDLNSNDFESDIEIKEKYDVNENLVFQGSYKKNIPIGVHRNFNKEGEVISSKIFDIYGNLESEGIVLSNGNEDNEWVYYHKNGKKQAVGTYNKGKKQGKWTYFYPNGKVQQSGTYTNGKLSGMWQWYYETGELLKEEFYIYGKLDGEAIEFSELGNIISKGNYVEGNKEVMWFYNIGDQELKGKYVYDLKDGIWESYYKMEHILSFKGVYLQGNPDGKHIYYYPNGNVKEERFYNAGQKVKSWSKYNERGELIIVIQFREGKEYKINGVRVKFNNDEN